MAVKDRMGKIEFEFLEHVFFQFLIKNRPFFTIGKISSNIMEFTVAVLSGKHQSNQTAIDKYGISEAVVTSFV